MNKNRSTRENDNITRFSVRLRQLRLALGLSMDELVGKIGGVVSKQALSKYERALMVPSPSVLAKLASALGIKTVFFFQEPQATFSFLGFRKRSGLGNREQKRLQNMLTYELEKRIRLCAITNQTNLPVLPLNRFLVRKLEDSERAAENLRKLWKLGLAPIANLTRVLEENGIQVLVIQAHEKFDGISAIASINSPRIRLGAVIVRNGLPGDRQRLSLAHELGHLVLRIAKGCNEEKAVFRFAGAFLAPAETLRAMTGNRRTNVTSDELLMLKKQFGISMAAGIYRLHDLGIISNAEARNLWQYRNAHGWRKVEPEPILEEKPQWIRQVSLRAIAEGLISSDEAERLYGQSITKRMEGQRLSPTILMRMPLEQRRRIMAQAVAKYNAVRERER